MKRWLLKRSKINTAVMAQELGIREATADTLNWKVVLASVFAGIPM